MLSTKSSRDYESECGDFDVDACFREDFDSRHRPKFYSITLDDYYAGVFVLSKKYYGTLEY